MRKSGWAAAAGIGSLVLLLAACGGSGANSAAGSASSAPLASSAASGTRAVVGARVIGDSGGHGHQERGRREG